MLNRTTCLLVLMLAAAIPARAEEIAVAAQDLCEKVKSCAMAQVAEEDLTPEVREMMQPMLDTMCENMQSSVGEVAVGSPLYVPAVTCMRSMESLSCEQMQDPRSMETPECETFQQLAREASANS
jgi:hypothetical protein